MTMITLHTTTVFTEAAPAAAVLSQPNGPVTDRRRFGSVAVLAGRRLP
jgi:hypothetical protein